MLNTFIIINNTNDRVGLKSVLWKIYKFVLFILTWFQKLYNGSNLSFTTRFFLYLFCRKNSNDPPPKNGDTILSNSDSTIIAAKFIKIFKSLVLPCAALSERAQTSQVLAALRLRICHVKIMQSHVLRRCSRWGWPQGRAL